MSETPLRGRLVRWLDATGPGLASGAARPEEVLDMLLDLMLDEPEGALIYEAGRGELPDRDAATARAVFQAMIEAVKAGA